MARHKPAAEGGYQRGEETRARLIDSAMRLFGERGFGAATTRDIAVDAGVNAPALQYYFGNKEGLYQACVEYIIERVWEQVREAVDDAERLLDAPDSSDDALVEGYLAVLGGFIGFIHDSPRASAWRQFMACAQAGHDTPDTLELMSQRLHAPIRQVTGGIIGRLTGLPADDERTLIRMFVLNSQGMVFRVLRQQVLGTLGWDSVDRERMEKVREVLLSQTRLMLRALVAERDAS